MRTLMRSDEGTAASVMCLMPAIDIALANQYRLDTGQNIKTFRGRSVRANIWSTDRPDHLVKRDLAGRPASRNDTARAGVVHGRTATDLKMLFTKAKIMHDKAREGGPRPRETPP